MTLKQIKENRVKILRVFSVNELRNQGTFLSIQNALSNNDKAYKEEFVKLRR